MMAVQNTADRGSQSSGGLYTGVSRYDGFIEDFTNWCLDSSRQPGDTGLVKNTGSSTQGWHIMYFVGWERSRLEGHRQERPGFRGHQRVGRGPCTVMWRPSRAPASST